LEPGPKLENIQRFHDLLTQISDVTKNNGGLVWAVSLTPKTPPELVQIAKQFLTEFPKLKIALTFDNPSEGTRKAWAELAAFTLNNHALFADRIFRGGAPLSAEASTPRGGQDQAQSLNDFLNDLDAAGASRTPPIPHLVELFTDTNIADTLGLSQMRLTKLRTDPRVAHRLVEVTQDHTLLGGTSLLPMHWVPGHDPAGHQTWSFQPVQPSAGTP
jgi:hypothetical protein